MDKCDKKIDLIEYLGQWPIFYGPVIFFYIFQIIWLKNGILVWHNDWPKTMYVGQ